MKLYLHTFLLVPILAHNYIDHKSVVVLISSHIGLPKCQYALVFAVTRFSLFVMPRKDLKNNYLK
jgi:hypothetical protein